MTVASAQTLRRKLARDGTSGSAVPRAQPSPRMRREGSKRPERPEAMAMIAHWDANTLPISASVLYRSDYRDIEAKYYERQWKSDENAGGWVMQSVGVHVR